MAMKALRQLATNCAWRNSFTAYHGWGQAKGWLRFRRSGDAGVEKGWATHRLRGDKKGVTQENHEAASAAPLRQNSGGVDRGTTTDA